MELLFSSVVCLTTKFAGTERNNGLKTTIFAIRLQTENQMRCNFLFCFMEFVCLQTAEKQRRDQTVFSVSCEVGVRILLKNDVQSDENKINNQSILYSEGN